MDDEEYKVLRKRIATQKRLLLAGGIIFWFILGIAAGQMAIYLVERIF